MDWNELVREYGWASGPLTALLWMLWGLRPRRKPAKAETDMGEVGRKILCTMRQPGWAINNHRLINHGLLSVNSEGGCFWTFNPALVEKVELLPWEERLIAEEYKVLRVKLDEHRALTVNRTVLEKL